MAKSRKPLTGKELAAFRHSVAVLKSKGLVSKRIDARSQAPTKYMRSKVRKLGGVLTGEQVGLKLKPDILRQYKEAGGFQIVNGKLVVEKRPDEYATIRRGFPVMRRALGDDQMTERLPLPIGPNNLNDFISDLQARPAHYDSLKLPDEYFSFKVFGHWSRSIFSDAELLAEYLENYAQEAFDKLELYRVTDEFRAPRNSEPKRRKHRTLQDRRQATARVRILSYEQYQERRAMWDKAYREKVAKDPAKLERRREKDRARQVKHREAVRKQK